VYRRTAEWKCNKMVTAQIMKEVTWRVDICMDYITKNNNAAE